MNRDYPDEPVMKCGAGCLNQNGQNERIRRMGFGKRAAKWYLQIRRIGCIFTGVTNAVPWHPRNKRGSDKW